MGLPAPRRRKAGLARSPPYSHRSPKAFWLRLCGAWGRIRSRGRSMKLDTCRRPGAAATPPELTLWQVPPRSRSSARPRSSTGRKRREGLVSDSRLYGGTRRGGPARGRPGSSRAPRRRLPRPRARPSRSHACKDEEQKGEKERQASNRSLENKGKKQLQSESCSEAWGPRSLLKAITGSPIWYM